MAAGARIPMTREAEFYREVTKRIVEGHG